MKSLLVLVILLAALAAVFVAIRSQLSGNSFKDQLSIEWSRLKALFSPKAK